MSYTFRVIAAAALVALLAFKVSAAGPENLPTSAVRIMTPTQFKAYAERHNAQQYAAAAKRATPGKRVIVQRSGEVTVTEGGGTYFGWGSGVFVEPTRRTTSRSQSQRVYELPGYGGGPVWIINPYCPPKR
jgi:hypothetical protein